MPRNRRFTIDRHGVVNHKMVLDRECGAPRGPRKRKRSLLIQLAQLVSSYSDKQMFGFVGTFCVQLPSLRLHTTLRRRRPHEKFSGCTVRCVQEASPWAGEARILEATATLVENRPRGGRSLQQRPGKQPELLADGDFLQSTLAQQLKVAAFFATALAVCVRVLSELSDVQTGLCALCGVVLGYLFADFGTGVYHWAVDNYGDRNTPIFGCKQLAKI